jgi:hypothetical protein
VPAHETGPSGEGGLPDDGGLPERHARIRWLAGLAGLDPPTEDLEYLAGSLEDHARMMRPLARYGNGHDAGYPDDDPRW